MNQTLYYHIDNSAYRFEINNIQYSLLILVQWRGIAKRRDLMGWEAAVRTRPRVIYLYLPRSVSPRIASSIYKP
jgi:hypothetical protein